MDKNKHFRTKVAIDFDEKAAETFKKNMPDTEVLVGDITDADVKQKVIELSRKAKVNMIVGGPPCQGYSMKGKKLGLKDPRNFLFREYLNLVKELQPDIFVIENVKGLLLASNGWFKDEILTAVSNLGYWVEYGVLNAADFGVPQSRERAIFICSKNKIVTQTSHTENIPYALINQLELNVESHSRTLLCTQTTHPKSGQIVQESFQERFDQQDF